MGLHAVMCCREVLALSSEVYLWSCWSELCSLKVKSVLFFFFFNFEFSFLSKSVQANLLGLKCHGSTRGQEQNKFLKVCEQTHQV